MARLDADTLKKLVRSIATAEAEEVTCEGCFDQLDRFVEQELKGKDLAQAMPLIKQHLEQCDSCCVEYEALLQAVKSIDAPSDQAA